MTYSQRANFTYQDCGKFGFYINCRDANGYNVCIHRVDSALAARLWISEAKAKLDRAMSN